MQTQNTETKKKYVPLGIFEKSKLFVSESGNLWTIETEKGERIHFGYYDLIKNMKAEAIIEMCSMILLHTEQNKMGKKPE